MPERRWFTPTVTEEKAMTTKDVARMRGLTVDKLIQELINPAKKEGVGAFFLTTEPHWGLMLASSVLITLPVTIFFVFVQKYITRRLAVGAIKW